MMYKKIAISVCAMGVLLFASCSDDNGPSPDDTDLARAQREIENLVNTPPSGNYEVGVFYQKDTWEGPKDGVPRDLPQFKRLTGAVNEADLSPKQTPITQKDGPVRESDRVNRPTLSDIDRYQAQVDACVNNGINFLVLPPLDYENGSNNRLSEGDERLCKLVTGYRGSAGDSNEGVEYPTDGKYVDLKELKYACTINLSGNVSNGINWKRKDANGNSVSSVELRYNNRIDVEAAEDFLPAKGEEWTRLTHLQALCEAVKAKFNEPGYSKVDGKPFVLLYDAHKLYAKDVRKLYDQMREWLGGSVYLVARNGDTWCPPARYEDFFINGHVDAITNKPMYDGMQWGQYSIHSECIYLNWEYSRNVWWNNFGIDFIPTGQLAFSKWVKDGVTKEPIIQRDEQNFRRTCAIMRGLSGKSRIMMMYSLNEYRNDSFLEPTMENGDKYLKIMKEAFNK